jgi:hypothetical protein
MDYLIEMLVNAIVSAFRDRTPSQPKPSSPRTWSSPQSPTANRGIPRAAIRRVIPKPEARFTPPRPKSTSAKASPSPRPVPAKPAAKPAPSPSIPPVAASLSATTIRQLIRSRPAALRSIIVLSEILQPPLGLR